MVVQLKAISKEFNDLKAVVAKIKNVEVDLMVEVERNNKELQENQEKGEYSARSVQNKWPQSFVSHDRFDVYCIMCASCLCFL
jgi:hypothetical protein